MDNVKIIQNAEKILGKKLRCTDAFTKIGFFPEGTVFPCCPSLINNFSIGNIFEQSFDEIWNGEKATEFKNSILDGNFKFCNLESCLSLALLEFKSRFNCSDEEFNKTITAKYPKEVQFNIDRSCNIRCITCRDSHEYNSNYVQKYFQILDNRILPILKETEYIYLNGCGEVFTSKLCRILIKKVTEQYPNIKFNIVTNGILANQETLEELKMADKLNIVEVSMHAFSEQTYQKIARDGNYNKLKENLMYLSQKVKNNELPHFFLNYVVTVYNYKEMIDFQKFAESIGANTNFWEYRKWGNAELDKHYDEVAVWEPTHPEYEKYCKFINDPVFKSSKCHINNKLLPLSTHC